MLGFFILDGAITILLAQSFIDELQKLLRVAIRRTCLVLAIHSVGEYDRLVRATMLRARR